MCVYLFAPSRGQPLCFSLWINNSATLGKIKTFKYSLKIWNEYWNKSSKIKSSHLFSILPKVPNEPWFEKMKLFRRISTQITRLRIGHSLTPAYLNKIGVRKDPFCNCDHSSYGDINHIYIWDAIEMWKKSIVSIWRSPKKLRFPQIWTFYSPSKITKKNYQRRF